MNMQMSSMNKVKSSEKRETDEMMEKLKSLQADLVTATKEKKESKGKAEKARETLNVEITRTEKKQADMEKRLAELTVMVSFLDTCFYQF